MSQPRYVKFDPGTRLGSLTVIGLDPMNASYTRVRCDCGVEYSAKNYHLNGGFRHGKMWDGVKRCRDCSRKYTGDLNHARSRPTPDGRTVAEIARVSGVKLNTVLVRLNRGWPPERLGEPVSRRREGTP